ncbi:hypothetical protein [Caballeronia insecticola]|uniref:Uncharacterized protein n=1 Tax=Caballeronia insecticola TaxID=758793 RepID=R4X4B2_9BURK|nr:hypothetical protein [Caballeronia insecticola]BAN28091.1 hypothetical protein BRPE64_DCDS11550 [Caballeronia insecticola]
MPTRLEFDTPEGRTSLPINDVQFMAYDAGELAMESMRAFVERMRLIGFGDLAEHYARQLAQNAVSIMELREAREDAEALVARKEECTVIADSISPRLEHLRQVITRTHVEMRESVDRLAALSAACDHALRQIPGYRPPMRRVR